MGKTHGFQYLFLCHYHQQYKGICLTVALPAVDSDTLKILCP